jgi:Protein kinase domain/PEGA domain
VLHQIGVGALGPVFRTYEPTRDRLVAVKVFRLDITPEQSASLADALARAAEAGLFHPSVVEPIAAGIEGTVAYRAEEYVAAESLDVAMRHYAPASPDKVLPFITQLAGAIDFARAASVGHGALHPRDIFVTPEEARATGFGVVDALERVGLRAPVRRPYSAPERVASESWGTPADVFSLAAIAFELLTGRRPSGIGDQIGALTGAPIAAHADRLHTVLVRAMDADPAARYPSALAFAGALEKASRGEVTSAAVRLAPPIAAVSSSKEPESALEESAATPPAVPEAAVPSEAVVQPIEAAVPDDIEAEREEDEAHWQLTRAEARESERPVEPEHEAEPLFSDEMVASASDRLALDAADLALSEPVEHAEPPRFADEFRDEEVEAPEPPPVRKPEPDRASSPILGPASVTPIGTRRDAQARSVVHPVPPPRERLPQDDPAIAADRGLFETHAPPPERARPAMLPIAVTLILGLLLGFVAGYGIRGRQTEPKTLAQDTTQRPAATDATTQGTAGAPQGRGKEWSEQAVGQPAAGQPRAVPSAPPASKPAATARASAPSPAAPRTGKITVRSKPAGAAVSINGKWRGRTPLVMDNVAFGKYAVRVALQGYDVERESVSLSTSDTSKSLSYDLKRQPAAVAQTPKKTAPTGTATTGITPGSVFVDSNPRGARVFLDGKPMGATPMRIPEVPIGSHVVRLELPDHRAWTGTATVVSGKDVRVTGSLEPIR